jgi:hypothetical protein
MSRIVHLKELLHFRFHSVPHVVHIGDVGQQVRHSSEKPHRDADITQVEFGRVGLSIMCVVFLGGAIVKGFEGALVVGLLPVLHVHHTGARRVMSHQDVISLVIVH